MGNNIEEFYASKRLSESFKEGIEDRPLMYYRIADDKILLELNSNCYRGASEREKILKIVSQKIVSMSDSFIKCVRKQLAGDMNENRENILVDLDITITEEEEKK